MLAFSAASLGLTTVSNRSKRVCSRRTIVHACAREMYPENTQKWSQGEVCTYCKNIKEVICPVCIGEGVLGRTILCYYCRGKKKLDCPLCAVDDIYSFSYTKTDKRIEDEENETQDEE